MAHDSYPQKMFITPTETIINPLNPIGQVVCLKSEQLRKWNARTPYDIDDIATDIKKPPQRGGFYTN